MAAARRIADEPAYVLHSRAWSESSLILEVFCRNQGRVTLVARGAKKPCSNLRPVLLPLQPLSIAYTPAADGGGADIHNLKGAQWAGGHLLPGGDALLSGLYLNELLLRLLARADPHAALFDAYAGAVRVLASAHGDALEPVLRGFELLLLRDIGLLPALDAQTTGTSGHAPLQPQAHYTLAPEAGLRATGAADRAALPGAHWQALQRALADNGGGYGAIVRACAPLCAQLKPQLRALLQYHCGSPLLRTRQLMMDLQALSP